MAGRGPVAGANPNRKDPSKRARRNAEATAHTILRSEQADQPPLPDSIDWPQRTRDWWAMWGGSPQAEHFGSTDWDYLLDTAIIHAKLWAGDTSVAAELRLRVAKFGATMEDRARLRMQFAQADEADAKRPATSKAAERYGDLRVVEPVGA